VRLDGIFRRFRDFYASRADTTTGKVQDQFGRSFDLRLVENTNDLKRSYRA